MQYGPTPIANPFAVLTLIAAPAIFTNASSILALGTANRLARAVDRVRALGLRLSSETLSNDEKEIYAAQLRGMEVRTRLLLSAMRWFYAAVGAFAAASLVSLLGAGLAYTDYRHAVVFSIGAGLFAGSIGFCGLVVGGALLVRETRMAVTALREEMQFMLHHLAK
jgi:hypothetical protein